VFVALVIQHEMQKQRVVFIWHGWMYHMTPHDYIRSTIFGGVIGHKICVLIFCTNFVQNISYCKKYSESYYRNANISSNKVPAIPVRFQ
jgi:hypothetical protein